MNSEDFKKFLEGTVIAMRTRYNATDADKYPYRAGCEYGRFEMAADILGQFEDLVDENDIIPKEPPVTGS